MQASQRAWRLVSAHEDGERERGIKKQDPGRAVLVAGPVFEFSRPPARPLAGSRLSSTCQALSPASRRPLFRPGSSSEGGGSGGWSSTCSLSYLTGRNTKGSMREIGRGTRPRQGRLARGIPGLDWDGHWPPHLPPFGLSSPLRLQPACYYQQFLRGGLLWHCTCSLPQPTPRSLAFFFFFFFLRPHLATGCDDGRGKQLRPNVLETEYERGRCRRCPALVSHPGASPCQLLSPCLAGRGVPVNGLLGQGQAFSVLKSERPSTMCRSPIGRSQSQDRSRPILRMIKIEPRPNLAVTAVSIGRFHPARLGIVPTAGQAAVTTCPDAGLTPVGLSNHARAICDQSLIERDASRWPPEEGAETIVNIQFPSRRLHSVMAASLQHMYAQTLRE
ncbi:hypothetical protein CDD83_9957 [Cordyceps sp. RAO-2017]|nr:hypothetical protein CDD83_9957 [Cordyceps sp. RAO-2017]